jgi:SAM-dependent methyltransferase
MQNNLTTEMSLLMKLARAIGFNKIAWSLRRLHCPVGKNDLVLEVGAGGNPYFRSNVLVDAYEATSERHWVPLTKDRPTVLAFVEKLPFKDKQFDFVIASHVLEHSHHPEQFLSELQRVAKAGYIEVPDAFMERINPYPDHRLEITIRKNRLVIKKKTSPIMDADLVELYEDRAKKIVTKYSIPKFAFDFHVRYYWKDQIPYEIKNPEAQTFYDQPIEFSENTSNKLSLRANIQSFVLSLVRSYFSQNKRNREIDLIELLQCTNCNHSPLKHIEKQLLCTHCNAAFVIHENTPDMTRAVPQAPKP